MIAHGPPVLSQASWRRVVISRVHDLSQQLLASVSIRDVAEHDLGQGIPGGHSMT